jgi:glycosyltransferase involved in cell wall biosynthesis
MPLHLLFVNRFFHPDHSATSQILSDLAFALADAGFKVEVLACRQTYDNPGEVLAAHENIRGVQVHRLWTTRFGRGGLLLRALDYASFYLSATEAMARLAGPQTVLIAKTDPPLISIPSAAVAWLRKAKLVNWTQDLFPEIAVALSVPGVPLVAPLLRRLRNKSLAFARANVVLGDDMAEHLRAQGIDDSKIQVIHNWSVSESYPVTDREAAAQLRNAWNLQEKFVVGYSGNFGRAHDFSTVVEAARRLRERNGIRFLFVGNGAQRAWLEDQTRDLPNVVFKPYQPLDKLHASLAVPDLHLVSLKPELEGLLLPSKLYAVLAAGKGVLFVGAPQGELSRLLEERGAGFSFPVGAGERLAAAIAAMADNPTDTERMGVRARALWAERFTRHQAHESWRALLGRLSSRVT